MKSLPYKLYGKISTLDDVVDAVKKCGKLKVSMTIQEDCWYRFPVLDVLSFREPTAGYIIRIEAKKSKSVNVHGNKYPKLENFCYELEKFALSDETDMTCVWFEALEKGIEAGEKLNNAGIQVDINKISLCQLKEEYRNGLEKHIKNDHEDDIISSEVKDENSATD